MSEPELFTRAFWKTAIARTISASAASAAGVLTSTTFHGIKDAPWYGVVSAAVISGAVFLLALMSGAGIRDAVPGDVTTRQALAALRPTGRHAKRESDGEPDA